jgi:hypothetical protein
MSLVAAVHASRAQAQPAMSEGEQGETLELSDEALWVYLLTQA